MEFRRSKVPIIAFASIFVLVFISQFTIPMLQRLIEKIHGPQHVYDTVLHSIANIVKQEGQTIEYSEDWFGQNYSSVYILKHVCPCKLRRRKKKDLIIVPAIKDMAGSIVFMRSLRRTGCFSTVAILATEEAIEKASNSTKKSLNDFGAHIVPIGKAPVDKNTAAAFGVVAMYDFMKSTAKEFDRVLMCNFDIAFQMNPFEYPMKDDTLYFMSERITMKEDQETMKLIKGQLEDFPTEWLDKPIVHEGQIMGDTAPMLVFLYRYVSMLNITNKKLVAAKTNDKGFFNILINSGELDTHHVPYVICDKEPFAAIFSSRNFDASKGWRNITYGNESIVPILQQYFKDRKLLHDIVEEMPRKDRSLTNYCKGMTDDEVQKITDDLEEKERQEQERRELEEKKRQEELAAKRRERKLKKEAEAAQKKNMTQRPRINGK